MICKQALLHFSVGGLHCLALSINVSAWLINGITGKYYFIMHECGSSL
jgi:hypothetical protein